MSEVRTNFRGRKKYWTLGVVASLVTTFIFMQPLQVWTQGSADLPPSIAATDTSALAPLPNPLGCFLDQNQQPLDPIDMNTVISGTTVKTIHVEKEIFMCDTDQGNAIFEVSVYTKLFEDLTTLSTVKKSFEIVTCVKNDQGKIFGCKATSVSGVVPELQQCVPAAPIKFPIEMNSVVGSGAQANLVKTVEAEKEVFQCESSPAGTPPKIKDVIIFTEMYEDIVQKNTIKRNFESAICVKDVTHAAVIACRADRIG